MQKRESKVKNKQPQRKKRNSSLEKQAPRSYIILKGNLLRVPSRSGNCIDRVARGISLNGVTVRQASLALLLKY